MNNSMPDTPMTGAAGGYVDQRSVVESSASGVAWPAIIGGAFASVALAVLLFTLGSGLGLASVSPWANTGASVTTVTVMTGIWLIVMHWLASGLGGYLTGRLRTKWAGLHTHEVFFRDTANGFPAFLRNTHPGEGASWRTYPNDFALRSRLVRTRRR